METKKTVKIAKNMILGKHKPAIFLRVLCWFTIIWDSLIALYMAGSGLVFILKKDSFLEFEFLQGYNQEFCFTYAGLHVGSLLSAILMYRMKKTGFYLYTVTNIAMLVTLFIYLENFRSDYLIVSFTLIMLALFATRLKKLN